MSLTAKGVWQTAVLVHNTIILDHQGTAMAHALALGHMCNDST